MSECFRQKMFDPAVAEECGKIEESLESVGVEQVFSELYQVIEHCERSIKNRISQKFIKFLHDNMDSDWSGEMDFSMNLNDMHMLPETRALVSLVYRDFLCTAGERQELMEQERKEAEKNGIPYDPRSLMEIIGMIN